MPDSLKLAPGNPKLAVALWALVGCCVFSLVYASGKLSGGLVPAIQIMWLRYCSGFITVSGIAVVRRESLRQLLDTRKRHLHVLRACCGVGGGACNIYGATHMPLADASALALLQGVFTMALAVLLLGERLYPRQIIAGLLCLGGALVIVRGDHAAGFSLNGLAPYAVILGALLVACEVILIKLLTRGESLLSMVLHVNGIAALLFALPVLWFWQDAPWPVIGALCLLGPMAILGQMCNVRAYRLADATFLAPLGYSTVAFSALIGWVAFNDLPGLATWAGTALIVTGGLVLLRRG
ncbi:DMT family transporter [Ferrovibrio sp.]|uniref:DMT family transporter n=1 Tax=Ferrovibrio sp. TaxID=1917215 RepID=UPI0025BE1196|nr:DMT family transporter [Ferrovibrio sp.]MBX3456615.1 DMT family transporter [Ferrovibrio sp.]